MKVAIVTPIRSGEVHADWAQSFAQTCLEFQKLGIACQWFWVAGWANVPRGRNVLTAQALAWGATDIVFIDSDIGWEADDLLSLLFRDEEVVGGAQERRKDDPAKPIKFGVVLHDPTRIKLDTNSGLIDCKGLNTSFLKVKASVFEAMADPAYRFTHPDASEGNAKLHQWFRYSLDDWDGDQRRDRGEDIDFCNEWRKLGGKVWVDPFIRLRHHEGPFCFSGALIDALNAMNKEEVAA